MRFYGRTVRIWWDGCQEGRAWQKKRVTGPGFMVVDVGAADSPEDVGTCAA